MKNKKMLLLWIHFLYRVIVNPFFNFVQDCDETFNYWEPFHEILFMNNQTQQGLALQTWEYSPIFALRSWCIVLFLPLLQYKYQIYIVLRYILSLFCFFCEVFFYKTIKQYYGKSIATTTAIILLCSSGMFQASNSFLPSSFTMYCVMLCYSFWLSNHHFLHIWCMGMAGIIGWPFCIVIFLPNILDLVKRRATYWMAPLVALVLLSTTLYYDSWYYYQFQSLVLSLIHLLLYNKGSGSEKYGVEPWYFYFKNLLLQFNIMFVMALCSIVYLFKSKYLIPFWLWFTFFTSLQHKEERFMYPLYPLLAFHASIMVEKIKWKKVLVGVFVLLCLSRSMSMVQNYGAPQHIAPTMYHHLQEYDNGKEQPVCIGNEWYRFPSSFFLPNNLFKLYFVEHPEFRGHLPTHFVSNTTHSTSVVQPTFNDQNEHEPLHYIDKEKCAWFIASTKIINFDKIVCSPLLNSRESPFWSRILYIPFVSSKYNQYQEFCLYKKKN